VYSSLDEFLEDHPELRDESEDTYLVARYYAGIMFLAAMADDEENGDDLTQWGLFDDWAQSPSDLLWHLNYWGGQVRYFESRIWPDEDRDEDEVESVETDTGNSVETDTGNFIPVSPAAVESRLRRKLAGKGLRLRKASGSFSVEFAPGDKERLLRRMAGISEQALVSEDYTLEEVAREWDVLGPYEGIRVEPDYHGDGKKIDLAIAMVEIQPILQRLEEQGRANMATMSPPSVLGLVFELKKTLMRFAE
jgi:hypothetical protein